MMALVAIDGVTVHSGAASTPAMPEMQQPSPNTHSQHARQVDAEQAHHLGIA